MKNCNRTVFVIVFALAASVLVGCGREAEKKESLVSRAAFDIPKSLMTRMLDARDRQRSAYFGVTNDINELYALGMHFQMTNAEAISARPRGEMALCNDKHKDEDLENAWPFDVSEVEARLESALVLDKDQIHLAKPEYVPEVWRSTNETGYVASNPTIRWINHEIESWAMAQLDQHFPRMKEEKFLAMSGDSQMPQDQFAWQMDEDMFFVIMRTDGAYNPREYLLIRWNGNDDPMFVASFDSFPNRREAWTMIHWRSFPEAENNLAVLMWRHQCDRLTINPFKIRFMLERAAKAGVPEARQNLEVLRAHMPEAWD